MSLQEIQKVTGGELSGADIYFNSVSIDTRSLKPDELFVAISGPNFNGNRFVNAAAEKNAVGAIVNKELNKEMNKAGENVIANFPLLKVDDTRIALGQMGAYNRQASNACVIALTGSQGKTTVKEMVAGILSECGEVLYTQGNLNNDYGVPLSLLRINAEHDFAVIELGASGAGEIAYTVALTKPKLAHITNISGTHLEGFGDIEGVAEAKGELWDGLDENGIAIINSDDDYASLWHKKLNNKTIITISAAGKESADYYVKKINFDNSLKSSFELHSPGGMKEINLPLAGKHNVANALAAAALSMEAGASLNDVGEGLEKIKAVPGRLCGALGPSSSLIIDDTYNASPASFNAAIDVLSALPGEKIIAMGDMGELGTEEQNSHAEVGRYAKEKGVNYLLATGELSQYAVNGFGENAVCYSGLDTLEKALVPMLHKDVTVLVKGSRSAGMEKLVQYLLGKED